MRSRTNFRMPALEEALLSVAFVLAMLGVLLLVGSAKANGGSYGQGYSASYSQGYTAPCTPTYSEWQWGGYASNMKYAIRWRWVTDCYSKRSVQNDGWLYTIDGGGKYTKWKTIADYLASKGDATYGINAVVKQLAKIDPILAKFAEYQRSPDAANPRDLLPDDPTQNAARQASGERSLELILKQKSDTERAQISSDSELAQAKVRLADNQAAFNAFERTMKQAQDGFLQTVIATRTPLSGEQPITLAGVENRELATYLSTSCVACHGGAKGVGGGLDFRDAAGFDDQTWKSIRKEMISGRMPKGGSPAPDSICDLLDDQIQAVRRQ